MDFGNEYDAVDVPYVPELLQFRMISGVYVDEHQNESIGMRIKMEHCALDGSRSKWIKEVRCRKNEPDLNKSTPRKPWINISKVFPDAQVAVGQNIVKLICNAPLENYEFAVFGTPEKTDRKRMQMGIFGEKPVQGRDWKIHVTLFDDTMKAFENVCEMEKGKGHQLLTPLAGLFVSNSDEDIKIDLRDLDSGWKILGSRLKTIKSKDAWNSPEDSADFPNCHFTISHVDKAKRQFRCGITASHEGDLAETEVVEVYDEHVCEMGKGKEHQPFTFFAGLPKWRIFSMEHVCETEEGEGIQLIPYFPVQLVSRKDLEHVYEMHVYEMGKGKGHQLLSFPVGLLVSRRDEHLASNWSDLDRKLELHVGIIADDNSVVFARAIHTLEIWEILLGLVSAFLQIIAYMAVCVIGPDLLVNPQEDGDTALLAQG